MTTHHEAISDPRALDEANARTALASACRHVDLPSAGAELIRIGSNAVFRLPAPAAVIARVSTGTEHLDEARKQVAVSHWLRGHDYPATRALILDQPVVAAGRTVTFWESVSDKEEYAPISDVARLIRRLHDLPTPPQDLALPTLQPFGSAGTPFPRFAEISSDDASFLIERLTWAREAFPTLPYALSRGHVHGDANVGNVLRDARGRPVLIDLDSFATGAREWDLIQTAIFADRLGWHTASEYRTFVEIYGYDITKWEAYPLLAEMRELAMTSWLCRKRGKTQRQVSEAAKRIAALRKIREHLRMYAEKGTDGRLFVGPKGASPRRSSFNRIWKKALRASKANPALHLHDLRHTGGTLAAQTGATLKEIMARIGHGSTRAAMIYQHATSERDRRIAEALNLMIREARAAGEETAAG